MLERDTRHLFWSLAGILVLLPVLAVRLLGPTRVYTFTGTWLDRRAKRFQRDGAFISAWLDAVPVKVGQVWWIHRDDDDKDSAFAATDHRRHWRQGKITAVFESEMEVQVPKRSGSGTRNRANTAFSEARARARTDSWQLRQCDDSANRSRAIRCATWRAVGHCRAESALHRVVINVSGADGRVTHL